MDRVRLLVLGGTRFVGRAVVADALSRDWSVTVFHRGRTGAAPPGVVTLLGDRMVAADLDVLARGPWDVVVDTWDGPPRAVLDSARLLAGVAALYVYVSSRSVYRPLVAGLREDAPVESAAPDATEGSYGALKAGGELAARACFGDDRVLVARTGLVLGPHEDVGRLAWWLTRMAAGGEVMAPGPPDLPLQYVDARDLAVWLLDMAAAGGAGAFNALSRPGHTTMAELLDCCRRTTDGWARGPAKAERASSTLRWTEPADVLAAGLRPWTDVPIWVPPDHPLRPLHQTDTDKAYRAGLRCRPIAVTVDDTWAWLRTVT